MKVVLIDDEPLALDYMAFQLGSLPDIEIIGKHIDPMHGKEQIIRSDAEIVFLDIHLPVVNGIELAEQLLEQKPHLQVVFVTAYDEYAVKAFELNALDYVVKPVTLERLQKTVSRLKERRGAAAAEPNAAADPDKPIRIKLFKQLLIETADDEFGIMQWRTIKAQELFLYLLQHRRELVRKSVLIDLLWPDLEDINKGYSQLYTAIYHVRKTLSAYGRYFELSNSADGYTLNVNGVILDTEEWEKAIQLDSPLTEEMLDGCTKAMELYTGDYLEDYDYLWAETERRRLYILWLRSCYRLAEYYKEREQFEQAMHIYIDICGRRSVEEEAHFELMQLYASRGQHVAVHRQYRILTEQLQEQLGEEPSPYITEWYQTWSNGEKE